MRRTVMWSSGRRSGSGGWTRLAVVGAGVVSLLAAAVWAPLPCAAADRCPNLSTIELLSIATTGTQADGRSELPAVSADGCVVAFKSVASNLVPTNRVGQIDVYVRDRGQSVTNRVPAQPDTGSEPNDNSYPPALDGLGRFIAFGSAAANLVSGDFNGVPDMFVYDRGLARTDVLTLVRDQFGDGRGGGLVPDLPPSVDTDGCIVAFTSSAADLVTNDFNESSDVFVQVGALNSGTGACDRRNGTIELISVATVGSLQGRAANAASAGPAISADGCVVAFYSDATNLVTGDSNEDRDVFVRDRCAGTTERVNVSSGGGQAGKPSQRITALPQLGYGPAVSGDGRFVAFVSDQTNLDGVDSQGVANIFVRDRQNGTTIRVSNGLNGEPANGPSLTPSISADGRFVTFQSAASNLVENDNNHDSDVFVVEVIDDVAGPATRASVTADGGEPDGDSTAPQISADGATIVFQSAASLVPNDTNNTLDIFATGNPLATVAPEATITPTLAPEATATSPPTESNTPTNTPTVPATTAATDTATPTRSPEGAPTSTATTTPTGTTAPTGSTPPAATPTRTNTTLPTTASTPTITRTGVSTPTPTIASVRRSSGGGGCSCKIDAREPDASALPAIALPLVLWFMRARQRRR